MKHHHALLALGAFVLAVFIFSNQYQNASAQTATAQTLTGMTFTMYHPIASDTGNKTTEGGANDAFGKPIVTATDIEEARSRGDSTAGNINNPITLAGDPSHYGEVYQIPSYSFTTVGPDGSRTSHTVTNIYGKVTDTGGDFRGRPDKIDIATDHAPSQALANQEDRLPNNTDSVQFIPANEKARQFAANQGTQTANVPAPTPLPKVAPQAIQQPTNTNQAVQAPQSARSFSPLWMSVPFCFKHTGPASKGFVAKAPTCNSGINYTPSPAGPIPVPVPDCGPGGALCTVPLGCLNLICKAQGNAIWFPLTGACGCG